jgi:hypothetical protein
MQQVFFCSRFANSLGDDAFQPLVMEDPGIESRPVPQQDEELMARSGGNCVNDLVASIIPDIEWF